MMTYKTAVIREMTDHTKPKFGDGFCMVGTEKQRYKHFKQLAYWITFKIQKRYQKNKLFFLNIKHTAEIISRFAAHAYESARR